MSARYGLLGWPVKHSVSPQMQGAGFAALGIDATYELLPVEPEHVAAKVDELKRLGFRGWNITVPHKGAMRQLVDTVEPGAVHADSVNTVLNDNGTLHGFSTDGYGLEMATEEAFQVPVAGNRFLFWGTGGACRATSTHFALQGAAAITLINRTESRAHELAAKLREAAPGCEVTALPAELSPAVLDAAAAAGVIYQCTSLGLRPDDPLAMPEELLQPGRRIMDMIYHPTRLLTAARERGCQVADGRAMLLYQGVRSFSIWTGTDTPPVEAMRRGLDAALSHA